jgi:hypothetical protein
MLRLIAAGNSRSAKTQQNRAPPQQAVRIFRQKICVGWPPALNLWWLLEYLRTQTSPGNPIASEGNDP